jgi:hypothetical protein
VSEVTPGLQAAVSGLRVDLLAVASGLRVDLLAVALGLRADLQAAALGLRAADLDLQAKALADGVVEVLDRLVVDPQGVVSAVAAVAVAADSIPARS